MKYGAQNTRQASSKHYCFLTANSLEWCRSPTFVAMFSDAIWKTVNQIYSSESSNVRIDITIWLLVYDTSRTTIADVKSVKFTRHNGCSDSALCWVQNCQISEFPHR